MWGLLSRVARGAAHLSGKVLGAVSGGLKGLGSASYSASKFRGSVAPHLAGASLALGQLGGTPESNTLGKAAAATFVHAPGVLGAVGDLAHGGGGALQGLSERLGNYGIK